MLRVWCLIREQPHYRHEAFRAGLAAAGFRIMSGEPHDAGAGDVLVIWNRYGHYENAACAFEARGGSVIVAENGYLGADGNGVQYYALALGAHNGGGRWNAGGPERWRALGIEMKPWRDRGEHILVCPQRGIGPRGYAQQHDWPQDVVRRLRERTRRPIRVRPHPGNWQKKLPEVPLERDLEGCWAMVTWASSAGLHSLLAGVPVFYEGPYWICAAAGERGVDRVERPSYPERLPAFERLAWAQWRVSEIASGEAFRRLLACG